jgi:phosphoribosylaminoimidazole-succinocarboxamide synthase
MLHDSPRPPVHTTSLTGLKKLHTGKVRDIYEIDADSMLIVTTDRLSAFDVVLSDPIPDKGRVLNSISNFWFDRTRHIVPNHLTGRPLDSVIRDPAERAMLADRAVIVKRLKTVPLEAVVRGYVIGSGWKDYQKTGAISGIKLPPGLQQAAKLPQTLFTPSTKAAIGDTTRPSASNRPRTRGRGDSPRACATRPSRCTSSRRVRARARHHHRRHQVRVRAGRDGSCAHRRGADARSSRFWPADTYARARARRPSTSSSCATISRRSTGTSRRRGRSCRRQSSRRPREISRACQR